MKFCPVVLLGYHGAELDQEPSPYCVEEKCEFWSKRGPYHECTVKSIDRYLHSIADSLAIIAAKPPFP